MKKRLISTAIAFIMVVNLVFVPDGAAVFTAGALTEGDWDYTVNSDNTTATVTKYNGSATTVTIPNSLDGKTVTVVGNGSSAVFSSGVRTVTIPNGVTSIGTYAFYYCSSLTSVTIPTEAKMSLYKSTINTAFPLHYEKGLFPRESVKRSFFIENSVCTIHI